MALRASRKDVAGRVLTASIVKLGSSGQWQDVLELLEASYLAERLPNVISVNAALSACYRNSAWAPPLALLSRLELQGPEPDAVSFQAAIHSLALGAPKRWPGALHLLRRMRRCRAEPSTTTLNEVLNVVEQGRGRWEDGLELGSRIAVLGLEPDVFTRGSLACACGRGVQWIKAIGLFDTTSSPALGGGIISSCTAALRWQWAAESLLQLRRDSLETGSLEICRRAVLQALGRRSCWELCCAELQEMWLRSRAKPPGQARPALRAYNMAMSACELSGRWRQALLLLRTARRRKVQLDEISFAAAASACTRRGLAWAFGLWLWEELRLSGGPQPDIVFLTATLTACEVGQRWHTAMKLHQQQDKRGDLESDNALNLAVMSCCKRGTFWGSALWLLGSMPLTYSIGNALVGSCSRALAWVESQLLLSSLPDPDVLSFAAFLEPSACRQLQKSFLICT